MSHIVRVYMWICVHELRVQYQTYVRNCLRALHLQNVNHTDFQKCLLIGGPPTIQGDKRLGHYDTTHADQFQQKWTSVLPSFSAVYILGFFSVFSLFFFLIFSFSLLAAYFPALILYLCFISTYFSFLCQNSAYRFCMLLRLQLFLCMADCIWF